MLCSASLAICFDSTIQNMDQLLSLKLRSCGRAILFSVRKEVIFTFQVHEVSSLTLLRLQFTSCAITPLCEAEGDEGVPVPFRYDVAPLESCRTHVFRANALGSNVEAKTASIGAVFLGKWDHLPESKVADVVWEAGFFCVASL